MSMMMIVIDVFDKFDHLSIILIYHISIYHISIYHIISTGKYSVLFGLQSGCSGCQRCWEINSSEANGRRVRA